MNLRHNFFIALFISLFVGVLPVAAEEPPSAMEGESIGDLYLGMPRDAALKYLVVKPKLGKFSMAENTGLWSQPAEFSPLGIRLTLVSDPKTAPQSVGGVGVTAPATLRLKTGIHIGSSESEVIAAYKAHEGMRLVDDGIMVDFPDGYLSIEIKGGKVTSMGLGYYPD